MQKAAKRNETFVGNVYNNPRRKNYECFLNKFYSNILHTIFDFKSPEFLESTRKYMQLIIGSERKKTKKDPFALKDYEEKACICAYMYQYCVYYSSTVMGVFVDMLNEHISFRNDLLSKKEIKICCFGGGSGTEAVGIGAAIELVLRNGKQNVDLCVTIIDNCKTWRSVFQKVAEATDKASRKVNWKTQFILGDVCDPLSADITASIKEADCITMVNFSSSVFSARTVKKHVIRSRIEETFKDAKPQAMIFYVDSSDDHYGMEIENIANKFPNLFKVYRQQEVFGRQVFLEKTTSAKKSLSQKGLEEYYLKDYPTVSASIWIKDIPPKVATVKTGRGRTMLRGAARLRGDSRPRVFSPEVRRNPKHSEPFTGMRLLRLSKGSHLEKYIDKTSEKVKKKHEYKSEARNFSKSKTRYELDKHD